MIARFGSAVYPIMGLCDPTLCLLHRIRRGFTKDKEDKEKSNSRFEGRDSLTDGGSVCHNGPSFGTVPPTQAFGTNSNLQGPCRSHQLLGHQLTERI